MSNTKISGLTASASNIAATDVIPVVQTTGVGPVKMSGLQLAGGLLGSTSLTGATVTTSQPVLNLSQTWNAGAVTFTGLKLNITNTASASASMLFDIQVGGGSYLNSTIGSSGIYLNCKAGAATFYLASFNTGGGASLSLNGKFCINDSANFIVYNSGVLGWTSGTSAEAASADVALRRDAAGVLSLRGSSTTTAAAMSLYSYGASPPSAPAASIVRIYADTSGAKIRLMAIFPSGAAQQIAIEP